MATRYWGPGGNGLWSSTTNWSTSSAGTPTGASVPGSADAAVFNSNSGSGTATVDSNVTIQTLNLTNFPGTLAFGTNTISLNSTGTVFTANNTHSVSGTPVIIVTTTGSVATGVTPGTASEANSISFKFTGGTYVLSFLIFANSVARNVDFTGFAGTWTSAGIAASTIYGSLTLSTGMTITASTNALTFGATSGAQIVTSNSKTFTFPLNVNGVGGTVRLADAMIVGTTNLLTHTNGTLDLNGKSLTVGTSAGAYTTATGTKVLTFNGGTLLVLAASTTAFNNAAPTGFSTVAGTGTGTISMTAGTGKTFVGGGSTYNCTISNDGGGLLTVSGNNTISTFTTTLGNVTLTGNNTITTIANGVQPVTFSFTSGTTTTVTNFNLSGISGSSVFLQSTTLSPFTISKASGNVLAQYLGISASTATGGATWYTANSTDAGGNSGWIFGVNKYWVGGTGNWSNAARWSTTTGGAGGSGITLADAAIFNGASGGGTATVDSNVTVTSLTMTGYTGTLAFGTNTISLYNVGAPYTGAATFSVSGTPVINITYAGANASTLTPGTTVTEANAISFNFTAGTYVLTITASSAVRSLNFTGYSGSLTSTTLSIYGDLNLGTTATFPSSTSAWTFASTNATARTITTNGLTLDRPLTFNGVSGTWQLVDDLTMGATRTLTHTNGTIDLNGKTLTVGTRYTTAAGTKNLTFNAGTLVCPNGNINSFNNAIPTGYTTTAGTGTGKINMTATAAKTFVGGGSTFNCTVSNGGTGLLTISGSNTIDTVTTTSGSIAITGSNTITTISNGVQPVTFTFTAATTQTITNWNVSGTAGNLVTIISSTAGVPALLSKASGTVSADYLSIKDSTALGGAAWYAGANSTNVSGNLGWIFTAPPANNYTITALNGSYTLNGQSIGIYRDRSLTSAYGSYSLAGQSATLSRGFLLSSQNGLYSITGQAIDITYTPTPPVTGPTQYFIEIRSFTQSRRI